eukprot:gene23943-29052_t
MDALFMVRKMVERASVLLLLLILELPGFLTQKERNHIRELDEDPPTEHAVGALLKRPCEHEGCSNSVVGTSVVALCGIHGGGYRKVKRTGRPEENGAAGRAGEKVANSSRAKPLIQ